MPLRIVVAEDEVETAQALQTCLEALGHTVHVAYDGEAALALIREHRPDLAMLDIAMPGMSGLDVAQGVQYDGPQPFLIAITGWDSGSARETTAEAGFHAHLVKPIVFADIETLVTKIDKQRRALRD